MPERELPRFLELVGPELVVRRRAIPHMEMGGSIYFVTYHLRDEKFGHGPTDPRLLSASERQLAKQWLLEHHDRYWHHLLLTVMPNHVHLLTFPLPAEEGERWYSLFPLLGWAKGRSSREINLQRRERGSIWLSDNHDRIVRDDEELQDRGSYILNNAVEAGLVKDPWKWDGLWWEGDGREGWQHLGRRPAS